MKNILMVLLAVLLGGSYVVAAAAESNYFFPVIYDSSAEPTPTATPTHTNTPRPPTPTPTATPTPVYSGAGYTWVFIGFAELISGEVRVAGLKPGHCYNVVIDSIQSDGTLAVLKAREIADGYWWCTSPPYNPDAPWPPAQFPPPTEIPPDIFYGEIFKMVIPRSVKIVCGYGDQTNCVVVRR